MILLTIGTQLSFDRLIMAVDDWAGKAPSDTIVVGQIGPTEYKPVNFKYQKFYSPIELESMVASANLVISHAGMGSIITALTKGKPIIIVPRLAELGEHRNDHQLATARKFSNHAYVRPVFDLSDLELNISELTRNSLLDPISPFAPTSMISKLRDLIDG